MSFSSRRYHPPTPLYRGAVALRESWNDKINLPLNAVVTMAAGSGLRRYAVSKIDRPNIGQRMNVSVANALKI